jgi:hypothetical protein
MFMLFPHEKCIEKNVKNVQKKLHHTYYVRVKFAQFFQDMSLIRLWHITHVEVVQFQCVFNMKIM